MKRRTHQLTQPLETLAKVGRRHMQKDPRVVCLAQHATPRTRATSDESKARDESSPPRADNALQSQRGGAATKFGERGGISPPVHSPQDRGADAAPLAKFGCGWSGRVWCDSVEWGHGSIFDMLCWRGLFFVQAEGVCFSARINDVARSVSEGGRFKRH